MPNESEEAHHYRRRLLQAKLGNLSDWRIPDFTPSVGPFDPSVFEAFEVARRDLITKCEDRLKDYSDDEIVLLAKGRKGAREEIWKAWQDYLSKEIERLKGCTPVWYAAGFGDPEHAARFEHWCKMPAFSVEEVLHLSIGIEPETFPKRSLAAMKPTPPSNIDGPLGYLMYRYDLLQRTFDPRKFGWSVRPQDFLEWADRVQFETHPEFLRLLRLYNGADPDDTSVVTQNKQPDRREIDSMVKLFTVIAIEYYGYDPAAKKSPIPKEIADMAAEKGINVSVETVRKYLKQGTKFLSKDLESE